MPSKSKSNPPHNAKGAGRPTPDGVKQPRARTVSLDDHTVAEAQRIGAGNLSAGIRIAVARQGGAPLQPDRA